MVLRELIEEQSVGTSHALNYRGLERIVREAPSAAGVNVDPRDQR
jgi:hypothetical protein